MYGCRNRCSKTSRYEFDSCLGRFYLGSRPMRRRKPHTALLVQQLRPIADAYLPTVQSVCTGMHRIRPHKHFVRMLHTRAEHQGGVSLGFQFNRAARTQSDRPHPPAGVHPR